MELTEHVAAAVIRKIARQRSCKIINEIDQIAYLIHHWGSPNAGRGANSIWS